MFPGHRGAHRLQRLHSAFCFYRFLFIERIARGDRRQGSKAFVVWYIFVSIGFISFVLAQAAEYLLRSHMVTIMDAQEAGKQVHMPISGNILRPFL